MSTPQNLNGIEELKAPYYLGGPIAEFFGGFVLKFIWKKI